MLFKESECYLFSLLRRKAEREGGERWGGGGGGGGGGGNLESVSKREREREGGGGRERGEEGRGRERESWRRWWEGWADLCKLFLYPINDMVCVRQILFSSILLVDQLLCVYCPIVTCIVPSKLGWCRSSQRWWVWWHTSFTVCVCVCVCHH